MIIICVTQAFVRVCMYWKVCVVCMSLTGNRALSPSLLSQIESNYTWVPISHLIAFSLEQPTIQASVLTGLCLQAAERLIPSRALSQEQLCPAYGGPCAILRYLSYR